MTIHRQFRRQGYRRAGMPWAGAPTPFRSLPNGGYAALHPTKGWRPVSPARLRAQARLAAMIERINLWRAA